MPRTLEILYLGPELTFSHEAAKIFHEKYLIPSISNEENSLYKGIQVELVPKRDQTLIESSLINNSDAYAVIPVCNSEIGDVYKFLPFYKYETVEELNLPVSFCLCSQSSIEDILEIFTIKVAYNQAKKSVLNIFENANDMFVPTNSTAAAAKKAASNKHIAAICSVEAAKAYGLNIIQTNLEGNEKNETTFQIFRNTSNINFSPPANVVSSFHYLTRGAAFYSGRHKNSSNEAFSDLLRSKKKLKIKWGVDPLQKTLHLGHLSNLLKLRDFLGEGHLVTIVIGTFTGIIGDPSGNLSQRPHVNANNLDKHAQSIITEINTVLGGYDYEILLNDELITSFDLRKFLKWMRSIDVRYLLDRQDYKKRLNFQHQLSTAEFIYPLFQAFDTAHIQPDIEIGGTDQLWNTLLTKDIMQQEGLKVPLIMLVNEVKGLDLGDKMSTFSNNALHLSDSKEKIKSKVLSIDSKLLVDYFIGLTRCSMEEISTMQSTISSGAENDINRLRQKLLNEIYSILGFI